MTKKLKMNFDSVLVYCANCKGQQPSDLMYHGPGVCGILCETCGVVTHSTTDQPYYTLNGADIDVK